MSGDGTTNEPMQTDNERQWSDTLSSINLPSQDDLATQIHQTMDGVDAAEALATIAQAYQTFLTLGEAIESSNQHAVAVPVYERCLQLAMATTQVAMQNIDASQRPPDGFLAEAAYNLGLCIKNSGDYEACLPHFQTAVREQKKTLRRAKQHADRQAAENSPELEVYYHALQRYHAMFKSYASSAGRGKYVQVAQVQSQPHPGTDALAWKTRGNAFYKIKQWRDAARCYWEGYAHAKDSDSALASVLMSNTAASYMVMSNARAAIIAAQRAVDLDATNAKAWYRLGVNNGVEGHHETAREALERALHLKPGDEMFLQALNDLDKITVVAAEAKGRNEMKVVRFTNDAEVRLDKLIEMHGRDVACPPDSEARCVHDIYECLVSILRRMEPYAHVGSMITESYMDQKESIEFEYHSLNWENIARTESGTAEAIRIPEELVPHTMEAMELDSLKCEPASFLVQLYVVLPMLRNMSLQPHIDGTRYGINSMLKVCAACFNGVCAITQMPNVSEVSPEGDGIKMLVPPESGGAPTYLAIPLIAIRGFFWGMLGHEFLSDEDLSKCVEMMDKWASYVVNLPKHVPGMKMNLINEVNEGLFGAVMLYYRSIMILMLMKRSVAKNAGNCKENERTLTKDFEQERRASLARAVEIFDRPELRAQKGNLIGRLAAHVHYDLGYACYELTDYEASARHYGRAAELAPAGSYIIGQALTERAAALAICSDNTINAGELRTLLASATEAFKESEVLHPGSYKSCDQSRVLVERILANVEGEPDNRIITRKEVFWWGLKIDVVEIERPEGVGEGVKFGSVFRHGEKERGTLTAEDVAAAESDGSATSIDGVSVFSPILTDVEEEETNSRVAEKVALSTSMQTLFDGITEDRVSYVSGNFLGRPLASCGDGGKLSGLKTNSM